MDPVRDRQVKFRQGSEDLLLHALRALRDEIPLKLFDRFRGGGRPQNPISLLVRNGDGPSHRYRANRSRRIRAVLPQPFKSIPRD